MAKIEGIRIQNFRALRDVTLGQLWDSPRSIQPLTPLTTVIGRNGVGKSSLFDAFGFLADCLKLGVEQACDERGRGGFQRIRSQGANEAIEFTVYYQQSSEARPITYELEIGTDQAGRPYVARERLRQRRRGQRRGWPFSFLMLEDGRGEVWAGDAAGRQHDEEGKDEEQAARESIEMHDSRRLGIASLGVLSKHPRIAAFREFMEGWYLSYFTPDAARGLPLAGPQRHLSMYGDNIGNVVQYMQRDHPARFERILQDISEKIPGIHRVETKQSEDGRLLLCFNDKGFDDPFFAQQMSDGTLKVFAYLLLLEDPAPPPFICIEEPENGVYHKLLEVLATEFRNHATKPVNAPQMFVTTHQPYFVDALSPEETWVMEKEDGFARIRRASDDPTVVALANEELPLGGLWYSDYLD